MALTNYNIVEDPTAAGLAEKVKAVLPAQQPLGGVIFNPTRQTFAQVMTVGTSDGGGGLPAGSVAVADGDDVATNLGDAVASVEDDTLTVNLPDTVAGVSTGDTVAVVNSDGSDSHNATATVADGEVTNVKLAAASTIVDNSDAVAVQNSAGDPIDAGVVSVANGAVTHVRLSASVAGVADGFTFEGVTGEGDIATITVEDGVITAIELSAAE